MNALMSAMIAVLLAYLCGSIPFGLLTARMAKGIDIREHGSGNIGATNVARVVGKKWGAFVLALDALKGLLPTLLLPMLLLDPASDNAQHIRVACGITTVVGHMFPCWLRFRGGKGVATALGVIIVLGWQATIAAAGLFLVVFVLTRYVAVASIVASLTYSAVQFWMISPNPFSSDNWSQAAFSILIPVLIIIRHHTNIARLLKGEESKMTFGSDKAATE
ncbi:MAG: glycerol-3-phosphate 1-O-acyltransferase PlsY [Planctomycetota bacterium]|nr:glycerol-3-phosphate 1-O-acyltransferase PlsY [Planctomycetota bacterium]